jgi:hypothetical protein
MAMPVDFFLQGDNCAFQGRRRLLDYKMQLAGSKVAAECILIW